MKEIELYPIICEKFLTYMESCLDENFKIEYSYNKTLPAMISEISEKLGLEKSEDYFPNLKLDILFGFTKKGTGKIKYVILEVKYLYNLALSEYVLVP